MNTSEHIRTILGVEGRAFARHVWPGTSLWSSQTWKASREWRDGKHVGRITVQMRFDDNCRNGHHTFAITGTAKAGRDIEIGGCIHEEIAKYFPELVPLIRWHLTSTDGPMHYIANTLYHAGDRDHNGLRKGESRQTMARGGKPMWELVAHYDTEPRPKLTTDSPAEGFVPVYRLDTLHVGDKPLAAPVLRWQPCMTIGEGKARQLDAARSAAAWPDATDTELCQEPAELKAALLARHPALMAEFRAAMDSCGFAWEAPAATVAA